MKIVLADDSKILRQRIISLLEEIQGVQVVAEAENSHQAIQYVEDLKPDLIILDIRMPDGGGLEALKVLKDKNISVTKMIFTNYPNEQYRKKCMELGADYFFDKSTDFEKMVDVVKKLVKKGK
jgi:DNA-binding NarL/FixJ family response regulator